MERKRKQSEDHDHSKMDRSPKRQMKRVEASNHPPMPAQPLRNDYFYRFALNCVQDGVILLENDEIIFANAVIERLFNLDMKQRACEAASSSSSSSSSSAS